VGFAEGEGYAPKILSTQAWKICKSYANLLIARFWT
jgi:hypothetical protein